MPCVLAMCTVRWLEVFCYLDHQTALQHLFTERTYIQIALSCNAHNAQLQVFLPSPVVSAVQTVTIVLPHSPNTCSSVVMLVIPSSFTAEQV